MSLLFKGIVLCFGITICLLVSRPNITIVQFNGFNLPLISLLFWRLLLAQIAVYILTIVYEICSAVTVKHFYRQNSECKCGSTALPTSTLSQTNPEDLANQFNGIDNFGQKLRQVLPYLWPKDSPYLQFLIVVCLILIILVPIVNFLVYDQYKRVISDITNMKDPEAYYSIAIFIGLKSLQGSIGLLSNTQTFAWIPVSQFTTRELSIGMLKHLHSLSVRFHLNRKTGEILRVQDRGVSSVVSVLTALLFNIVPTLIDLFTTVSVLSYNADLYIGLAVLITALLYIYLTVKLTDWRTKYRRECNRLDNAVEARAVDSLLNFETVKYFSAESFEVSLYAKSIDEFQQADVNSKSASAALATVQNLTIQIGLAIGCLIAAYRVLHKQIALNEFIATLAYIQQAYTPLSWFGGYYRTIQKNFVDMEKMLDLFKVEPEPIDHLNPQPFTMHSGKVEFDNVHFGYDKSHPILKGISFKVEPGTTIALVGPSGGGKSTILRLLLRFYDCNQGKILVDDHDVKLIKQADLRKSIGVVPQDTVLFNDDIFYNILYGDPAASANQVQKAAEAARIHDRILSFKDGYQTKVGERGLRLSGGEKQRVAIARTFLRDPKILLLDEATSALDTNTERHIQASLNSISKGRTTLIVAHRLSTVVDADLILVLKDGLIVERGNHHQLMQNYTSGVYFDMWTKQLADSNKPKAKNMGKQISTSLLDQPVKLKFRTFNNNVSSNDISNDGSDSDDDISSTDGNPSKTNLLSVSLPNLPPTSTSKVKQ